MLYMYNVFTAAMYNVEANGLVSFGKVYSRKYAPNLEECTQGAQASFLQAAKEEQALLDVVNGDSYVQVEDDVLYSASMRMTTSRMTSLMHSPTNGLAYTEKMKTKTVKETKRVTKFTQAAVISDTRQQYFLKQGVSNTHNAALNTCAHEVKRAAIL